MIKWVFYGFGIFLIIAVIGGVTGTLSTIISTPGRVINKTLETNNVIQSYEWFYDTNAAYISRLNQLNQYKEFMAAEEDKFERRRVRIELAAMQQTCRDIATRYNANSEKMNKSIFKGWELPNTLSVEVCN